MVFVEAALGVGRVLFGVVDIDAELGEVYAGLVKLVFEVSLDDHVESVVLVELRPSGVESVSHFLVELLGGEAAAIAAVEDEEFGEVFEALGSLLASLDAVDDDCIFVEGEDIEALDEEVLGLRDGEFLPEVVGEGSVIISDSENDELLVLLSRVDVVCVEHRVEGDSIRFLVEIRIYDGIIGIIVLTFALLFQRLFDRVIIV